ncbi:MAG: nuclease-related domain-containing protein [Patescibacteria group bacterium]|jgi:hypothetical protein|nr:nuclease-related domain-containing protein [Patescibacteria group bacterium]
MNIFKKEKSYSKQKIKINLIKQWIFYIFAFLLIVVYLSYSINKYRHLDRDTLRVFALLTLGFLSGILSLWFLKLINNFFSKTDTEINKARKGNEGEKLTYLNLVKFLGNNYKIYKNFKIPNRKFDIDFLIVGPKGLIVIEVKNSSNSYIFTEKEARRIKGEGYSRKTTLLFGNCDPRVKLINHCKSLNHYLYSLGLVGFRIKKALLFINGNISINDKSGVYIINGISKLREYIEGLNYDDRFTAEFCETVNRSLIDKI